MKLLKKIWRYGILGHYEEDRKLFEEVGLEYPKNKPLRGFAVFLPNGWFSK